MADDRPLHGRSVLGEPELPGCADGHSQELAAGAHGDAAHDAW
jgi:hypothetical protein